MRRLLSTIAPGPQAAVMAASILGTGFLNNHGILDVELNSPLEAP